MAKKREKNPFLSGKAFTPPPPLFVALSLKKITFFLCGFPKKIDVHNPDNILSVFAGVLFNFLPEHANNL